MNKILCESLFMGTMTLIIGKVINKVTKKEDKIKNNKNIIIFFLIGFISHCIMETFGINCWYCDKKCTARICNFIN